MWHHVKDTGKIENRETKTLTTRSSQLSKENRRNHQSITKQEEYSSQRTPRDSKKVSSGWEGNTSWKRKQLSLSLTLKNV